MTRMMPTFTWSLYLTEQDHLNQYSDDILANLETKVSSQFACVCTGGLRLQTGSSGHPDCTSTGLPLRFKVRTGGRNS